METVAEHPIEREVAAPPPRAARLPLGLNFLIFAAGLMFTLFIGGGGYALLESAKLGWVSAAGRTVTAHVAQIVTEPAPVKGQPARQTALRYVFTSPFDQSSQFRWLRLDRADDSQTGMPMPQGRGKPAAPPLAQTGDPIPVRGAIWLGRPLFYPWTAAASGRIVFLMLSGALIVGISVFLLRRLLAWRRHRLHLLRAGIATVGTVIDKEARSEDTPRYFVRYGYATDSRPQEREEQVSMEQWREFEIGQPVTVLYDPEHSEDAGLYALLGRKA